MAVGPMFHGREAYANLTGSRRFACYDHVGYQASAWSERTLQLSDVPEQPGHQVERFLRHREQDVLIGRMLGAAGIGMRQPDRGYVETISHYPT